MANLEVLVSPVVEACPNENKEKAMSLLHSFYCWGQVVVVLLSTLFFSTAGIQHWKIMTLIWVIVPVVNGIVFFRVPIRTFQEDGEKGMGIGELTKQKMFWLFMLLVMCAGACEHSVGQWASTFAEQDLGCSIGPGFVGVVAENHQNDLHMGIGAALIFPVALVTIIIVVTQLQRKNKITVQSQGS